MDRQNAPDASVAFASNEIRLSRRQLLCAALLCLGALVLVPRVWLRVETFAPGPDYRVPYAASDDYWVYRRLAASTRDGDRILVIGDSVVWGEYVTPDQTLTHYLNEHAGRPRFVNGGLNGSHPLALEGLVRHHAQAVTGTKVMLHCNLLWTSSPERDLRVERAVEFNHPELVPQWLPPIPSYEATQSDRLGVVFDRTFAFRVWVRHVRHAHLDGVDLHTWSLDNPYALPAAGATLTLPGPRNVLRHRAVPWTQQGIPPQDMSWVSLAQSPQFRAMRSAVALLEQRGNRVFVLVGPFNEHLLTDAGRAVYRQSLDHVAKWLAPGDVPHLVPPALPSDEYGDASHPLSAGYARLARTLFDDERFQAWLGD